MYFFSLSLFKKLTVLTIMYLGLTLLAVATDMEGEQFLKVEAIRSSGQVISSCPELDGQHWRNSLVLLQGSSGFLGDAQTDQPWFTLPEKDVLDSREMRDVLEQEDAENSDGEWVPNAEERPALAWDLKLLHTKNCVKVEKQVATMLDLQFASTSRAADVLWQSQNLYGVPQNLGHGWNFWLKPEGTTRLWSWMLEGLNLGAPRDIEVTGPDMKGRSRKKSLSYQPLTKDTGRKEGQARKVIESFCRSKASFVAMWVSPLLVKPEMIAQIAKDWNLDTVDKIVEALSVDSLQKTHLCSLAVSAEDAGVPFAVHGVWDAMRGQLIHEPVARSARYEFRVATCNRRQQSAAEVVEEEEEEEEGDDSGSRGRGRKNGAAHGGHADAAAEQDPLVIDVVQSVFEHFNLLLDPRRVCSFWQDAEQEEEFSRPLFAALRLEDVLLHIGWSIQYFCWAVRHVVAHWLRALALESVNRVWHSPPRSILIALHLLSESLCSTLMGTQPLCGDSARSSMSGFSTWFNMPSIQMTLGAAFAGGSLETYHCPTTDAFGDCPYDGCCVSVALHDMPPRLLELSKTHKPTDYVWSMDWIQRNCKQQSSAQRAQETLFDAAYGSREDCVLKSNMWSSLLLPSQRVSYEELEQQEGNSAGVNSAQTQGRLVFCIQPRVPIAPPARMTWERVIRYTRLVSLPSSSYYFTSIKKKQNNLTTAL